MEWKLCSRRRRMNKRLDRTRGRWRQDDQQDILKRNERLQNGGRIGRTKRLLETLTDEDEDQDKESLTLTLTLTLTLDLYVIPRTLKIGNPHNGAFPLLL